MRKHLPDRSFFLSKCVPTRDDLTIVDWVASGNDGHLFRGRSATLNRDLACKVIPRENLQQGPEGSQPWKAEVHKADVLRSPTVVKFEAILEWRDVDANVDCVVLISELVEGVSLKDFMSSHRDEVTVPFIRHWLETMLNLLFEMEQRHVVHGDLHAGNILVEDRSSYDLIGPRFVFRVTDFGVAEATSEPRFKDDFLQLAHTLTELLRCVDSATLSSRDKFIYNFLRDSCLQRHLLESDVTRDPLARNPRGLLLALRDLEVAFELGSEEASPRLLSPFDFLSCEQIGDAASLLRALYSDRFLGLAEVESQNNVVVTGPRGCGKSMVFRSLSLEHRLRVDDDRPDAVSYLGLYYRCEDLYFAFPRYRTQDRVEAVDIPIHFLTATLLARLLAVVQDWARKHFRDALDAAEPKVSERLWNTLGMPQPRLPGTSSLNALVSALDRERVKACDRQRFAHDEKRPVGPCFGVDVLVKACETLVSGLPFLKGRPIYFFIDDYSAPKVTFALQASLNRLLMQRTSVCFFKLSTESPVSFATYDIDQKHYVEGREYALHNLGLVYLRAESSPKLTFIDDVFRRRLVASPAGSPYQELTHLVGSNPDQNNNQLARSIRGGEKPPLWGKETLCRLCSGDIHYVISLVGEMVKQAGGMAAANNGGSAYLVPQPTQNRAIREAAGFFLKSLRSVPRYGEELVASVEAFGNIANSHLKFLNSKNQEGVTPKQASRIEPYDPPILSEKARVVYNELLRYSVFIEDFRGKSRRGGVVPRLYLRRFLIPHFNLTFSMRDSIELEPSDFELFLTDPKSLERKLRIKSEADADRHTAASKYADDQLPLGLGDSPS